MTTTMNATTPTSLHPSIWDPLDDVEIARANFVVLLLSSVIFTYYYAKSVSPATLERTMGPGAYPLCGWYRVVAGLFMTVAGFNYAIYYYYPLPEVSSFLPRTFPWQYAISAYMALAIAIPSSYLMCRGMYDAGEETMTPKKEHEMYSGIYRLLRHPQAVGEFPLWWSLAFLAHSPFLVLFSFVYLPVWYYFCIVEERDLILRFGKAYTDYQQQVGCCVPKDWSSFSNYMSTSAPKTSKAAMYRSGFFEGLLDGIKLE